MNKKIELLSPVGNFESLKCAVYNGANAVYLGLNNFNARNNIDNFSFDNLSQAVNFAHLYNVKVYLTLNTLAGDDEFSEILEYVKKALSCKVDAFIIQDIGLAYFLRQNFPFIELHASTQMGINNLEGIENIKDLNFSRVVLARETPLTEIKRIKDGSNVEIEYFIQGALCVSFSGNCYLCSLLANASGNRGKCKQFCRLPYLLAYKNIKEKGYFLSTKDFCMIPYLKQLADSGVGSFKIEGRARRAGYVAVATGVYRKVIDRDFHYDDNDILSLKFVYNRGGFIGGYFGNEKIIYPKAQNHIGEEIGEIENIKKGKNFNEITIKSCKKLKKGDLLKIFNHEKEIGIISVVDIKQQSENRFVLTSTSFFPKNSKVCLIVNSALEESYINKIRQIPISVRLILKENQNAQVYIKMHDNEIFYQSDIVVPRARTSPITEQDCITQFSKLGENFYLQSLTAECENVFLTKAQLNTLRRESLAKLEEKILQNYENKENIAKKSQFLPKNIEIFDNLHNQSEIIEFDDFSKVSLEKNKIYIFKPYVFDERIINLYQSYSEYNIFLSLPIMADKNEIEIIKNIIKNCSKWGVVANNYYALSLTSKDKTIIGSNMNVYNSYAVKYYASRGYKNIILSIENHPYIKNCGANIYCYKKYYPQYMYFGHCPFKEHLASNCKNCKYDDNLTYKLNDKQFAIKRIKVLSCQFILKSKEMKEGFVQKNSGLIEEV